MQNLSFLLNCLVKILSFLFSYRYLVLVYPILDTRLSVRPFVCPSVCNAQGTPTEFWNRVAGNFWSNWVVLILKTKRRAFSSSFGDFFVEQNCIIFTFLKFSEGHTKFLWPSSIVQTADWCQTGNGPSLGPQGGAAGLVYTAQLTAYTVHLTLYSVDSVQYLQYTVFTVQTECPPKTFPELTVAVALKLSRPDYHVTRCWQNCTLLYTVHCSLFTVQY